MSVQKNIVVRGAEEHNLKGIDVSIPRDKLTVITGVSGSGKSSLAFDTIYAEGQRRFMESLSSYARQFLTQTSKPKVESIEGLGPTIAIEQRKGSMNPRSTVATVTEIYDYLRVLYARVGRANCPKCKKPIKKLTSSQIVDRLMSSETGRFSVLAPLVRGRKGEHRELLEMAQKESFIRVKIDGENYLIEDVPPLEKKKKHSIAIVVDRLKGEGLERSRLAASVETALKLGKDSLLIDREGKEEFISAFFSCPECDFSFGEIEPRNFSFNSPFGACPDCHGLGTENEIDEDLLIPNPELSLEDGVLRNPMKLSHFMWLKFPAKIDLLIHQLGINKDTPFYKLKAAHRTALLYGVDDEKYSTDFAGVITELNEKFHISDSESTKGRLHQYMSTSKCESCQGSRLKIEMQAIHIGGKSLPDFTHLSVKDAIIFFEKVEFNQEELKIASEPVKEILSRLSFMEEVGLHYLSLDRTSGTLSGGEAQRIRLASQIGSRLLGVIYVLDEPSIGLHQRDNDRLIQSLKNLRDLGNTVLVVEHDEATIRGADYLLDIGPRAGEHGGELVFSGTPAKAIRSAKTLTAQYLRGEREISIPVKRRQSTGKKIVLTGASGNNLKKVKLEVPLGQLVVITGVSGSGKSTLINQTLYPVLKKKIYKSSVRPAPYTKIEGVEEIDKVIDINQSPIGKSSRSNPATYVGIFDPIRTLFSKFPLSKTQGYKPGRFSFNVKGGRCEACEGQGVKVIEMHFLADVAVTCEVCMGKRYSQETLEVEYKGRDISDILNMTVFDACELFRDHPRIIPGLKTLVEVGLGYIRLGQSSTTLSGGESQRIKLASELSKKSTGQTLYILDEPTTGLHFEDIRCLLGVLDRLVEGGNTVVVIEHNLDVIKVADHIVDLGPEGGEAGGQILVTGTPEKVSRSKKSHTGKYLKEILK